MEKRFKIQGANSPYFSHQSIDGVPQHLISRLRSLLLSLVDRTNKVIGVEEGFVTLYSCDCAEGILGAENEWVVISPTPVSNGGRPFEWSPIDTDMAWVHIPMPWEYIQKVGKDLQTLTNSGECEILLSPQEKYYVWGRVSRRFRKEGGLPPR